MKNLALSLLAASTLCAKSPEPLIAEGDAASEKNRNTAALEAYLEADSLRPDNAEILWRIAFLESPGKKIALSKRVREEAERATELDPRSHLAWHILGRWNYDLANFNPFLKSLAQTVYGKFPDALNENAARYLRMAIEHGPPRAFYHVEYGRALAALGRGDEARRELERGLALPSTEKDAEETRQRAREALRNL